MQIEYKIFVACGSYSDAYGGLEIMAEEHIKQLKNHKLKPVFLSSGTVNKSLNFNFLPILNRKSKISSIIKLRKAIKKYKPYIIHTHHSHDLWIIVPSLLLTDSKYIRLYLTRHMASGISKKDIFHKILYKRVNKIFAVSNFIKENVLQTCPVPKKKVYLLPNGINLNEFDFKLYSKNSIRNELGIADSKIVIGLIGRITLGKGHYEFIKAAEIINKKHLHDVTFLVVGSSSDEEKHIEAEIKKLAGDKNINNMIFSGYRNDIANVLAGVDILAFPSHEESFGITLLEAMAMKVPAAASQSAGVTDIIPDKNYGLLFPPKNHEALAKSLNELIENPALRKTLGENGRRRVEENFNIEKITNTLLKYYEES